MPVVTRSANSARDRCDLRLGFSLGEDPAERLEAIARFLADEAVEDEIYLTGMLADRLENYCAKLFGKPAALWFPSGTLAQMTAALIHAEETGRSAIGLHPTSHLLLHEKEGVEELARLEPVRVGSWHDVIKPQDIPEGLGALFIEIPQRHNGGLCPDWDGLSATVSAARIKGARLHMDGARLWSVRHALGAHSFSEICQPFDSIYASFYKDIGALSGAILVGEPDFIEKAKIWRHRAGGQLVRAWVEMADALRLLPKVIDDMPVWVESAGRLASSLHEAGLTVEPYPVQTNMFHVRLPINGDAFAKRRDTIAETTGVWLGGSTWDLDSRPGCSFEISVNRQLSKAEIQQIVGALLHAI